MEPDVPPINMALLSIILTAVHVGRTGKYMALKGLSYHHFLVFVRPVMVLGPLGMQTSKVRVGKRIPAPLG